MPLEVSVSSVIEFRGGYTGNSNVFIGYQAGMNMTTGHMNIAIGYSAGGGSDVLVISFVQARDGLVRKIRR